MLLMYEIKIFQRFSRAAIESEKRSQEIKLSSSRSRLLQSECGEDYK
jgi:hypothetical protein